MNDNWKAFVEFNPGMLTNSVYLVRSCDYGVREYLRGDNSIVTFKAGEVTKENIMFAHLDEDQMKALMAAFDKYGIKPPEASYIQGKLEATEAHLEDMRSMVLKGKKR